MEADLLGIPKPSSGPGKTTVKGPGKCDSLGGAVKTAGKLLAPEKGKKEILLFFSYYCKRVGGIFIQDREENWICSLKSCSFWCCHRHRVLF